MSGGMKTGRKKSKPIAILLGIGISLATTLFFAAMIAYLVITETLGQAAIAVMRLPILVISTAAGAMMAYGILKENRIPVTLITAGGYFTVLLLGNVFGFGGEFAGFWSAFVMVVLGCGIAILPAMHKKSGKRKYKIPTYR